MERERASRNLCNNIVCYTNNSDRELYAFVLSTFKKIILAMLFQVSFSISVYNACNEYAASYNDKMVDATSSVIKKKALETILSYFENGRLKFWCHILTQIVNPLCLMSLQSCLLLFSFSTFFLKLIHTFFSPDHIPLLHMLPLLLALDCVHIITLRIMYT